MNPYFVFHEFRDVLSEPPKQFLVKPLIAKDDIVMLYGPGKVGKSFVALDLMASLVQGHCTFADRYSVDGPVSVLYATGEGQSGLPNRMHAIQAERSLTPDECARFWIVKQVPQLFRADPSTGIDRFVLDFQSQFVEHALVDGLLVIDTWARAIAGADENTSRDTTEILNALSDARERLGCTILVVHHANKGGEIRGSSNIQAGFDSVIHVRKSLEGRRTMGCGVAKDAAGSEEVSFEIEPFEWTDGGETHTGGRIKWDEIISPDESKADLAARAFRTFLCERARGPENALPLTQLSEHLPVSLSPKTMREIAERELRSPGSIIRAVEKSVTDKTGRINRLAVHYFADLDCLN